MHGVIAIVDSSIVQSCAPLTAERRHPQEAAGTLLAASVAAAHSGHEAVERIPVVQKLVAHTQERELLKAAARSARANRTLVHSIERVLVIPAHHTEFRPGTDAKTY